MEKCLEAKNMKCFARYEVCMVMKIQVEVFWAAILCSDVVRYQCFGGPCCLHPQTLP